MLPYVSEKQKGVLTFSLCCWFRSSFLSSRFSPALVFNSVFPFRLLVASSNFLLFFFHLGLLYFVLLGLQFTFHSFISVFLLLIKKKKKTSNLFSAGQAILAADWGEEVHPLLLILFGLFALCFWGACFLPLRPKAGLLGCMSSIRLFCWGTDHW